MASLSEEEAAALREQTAERLRGRYVQAIAKREGSFGARYSIKQGVPLAGRQEPSDEALEAQGDLSRAFQSGWPAFKGSLSHLVGATMENVSDALGAVALVEDSKRRAQLGLPLSENRLDDYQPFPEATQAVHSYTKENLLEAARLMPEDPNLMEQVAAGIIPGLGSVAELAPAMMLLGPAAIPIIFADRASRDPFTGEFTSAYETGKGMVLGYATDRIFKGGARARTRAGRMAVTGAGMAGISTVEGGGVTEGTAAAILGATLASVGKQRQSKTEMMRELAEKEQVVSREAFLERDQALRTPDWHDTQIAARGKQLADWRDNRSEEIQKIEALTDAEFYERADLAEVQTFLDEKTPGRYQTTEELELMNQNWPEYSKSRGYTPEEIGAFQNYIDYANTRRGMEYRDWPSQRPDFQRAERAAEAPLAEELSTDPNAAVALPGELPTLYERMAVKHAPGMTPEHVAELSGLMRSTHDSGRQMEMGGAVMDLHGGLAADMKARGFEPLPDGTYESKSVRNSLESVDAEVDAFLGLSPGQIIARRDANFERTTREQAILSQALRVKIEELGVADRALKTEPSAVNEGRFARKMLEYNEVRASGEALGSDAGRALQLRREANAGEVTSAAAKGLRRRLKAFSEETTQRFEKLIEKAEDWTELRNMSDAQLVKRMGGSGEIQDFARMLRQMEDPQVGAGMIRFAGTAAREGWGWFAANTWMAGLLSSPSTWRANIKGNLIMQQLVHGPEAALGYTIGAAERVLITQPKISLARRELRKAEAAREQKRGWEEAFPEEIVRLDRELTEAQAKVAGREKDARDRLYFREGIAEEWGILTATGLATQAMRKSWKSGEEFSMRGIKGRAGHEKHGGGKGNVLYDWPFRALTAQDAFFKAQGYYARINGLAMRKAIESGTPFAQLSEVAQGHVKAAHGSYAGMTNRQKGEYRSWIKQSMDHSAELTYTNKLSEFGELVVRASNVHPAGKLPLTFVRTPTNLVKQAIYRIPLAGLIAPKMRTDIRAGGRRMHEALAKQGVAAGMVAMLYDQFWDEDITGARQRDPAAAELDRSMGVEPMSHRFDWFGLGDEVYSSYQRDMPISIPIAVVATLVNGLKRGFIAKDDIPQTIKDVSMMTAQSLAETVMAQPTLQNPQRIVDAVSDPRKNLDPWLEQMAGSVVPAGINWMTRAIDPMRRDRSGFLEAVAARLLGWSETLPVMHDSVGRPMFSGGPDDSFIERLTSEFNRQPTPHPILNVNAIVKANITRQGPTVKIDAKDLGIGAKSNEMMMRGLQIRDDIYIELTPTEREFINGNSNRAAAQELMESHRLIDESGQVQGDVTGRVAKLLKMPEDTARQRINKAKISLAIRDEVQKVYRYHNQLWKDQLVRNWVEQKDQRLMRELDRMIGQQKVDDTYWTERIGRGQ